MTWNQLTDEDRKAIRGYSDGNAVDYDRAIHAYCRCIELTDPHIQYMKEATSPNPCPEKLDHLKEIME